MGAVEVNRAASLRRLKSIASTAKFHHMIMLPFEIDYKNIHLDFNFCLHKPQLSVQVPERQSPK